MESQGCHQDNEWGERTMHKDICWVSFIIWVSWEGRCIPEVIFFLPSAPTKHPFPTIYTSFPPGLRRWKPIGPITAEATDSSGGEMVSLLRNGNSKSQVKKQRQQKQNKQTNRKQKLSLSYHLKSLGHGPGQPAIGGPAWAEGWTRWPPEVPSNINHSMKAQEIVVVFISL